MALKKVPRTVTFKGTKYELIVAGEDTVPDPDFGSELAPAPQDIFVRMSTPDLQLLMSMPEAVEGPLNSLCTRARSKKLDSGRAEVMASEEEVRVAVDALKNFVASEPESPERIHAQDLASTWERNYTTPSAPLPKELPSYDAPKLPPSSNLRMFSYRGAKYVLVRADEETPDHMKKRKSPTYEDVIENEVFSDLVKNIRPSVKDNIPVAQLKRSVDAIQQAEGSLRKASDELNNDRSPGVRWLTDAFFFGKKDKLEKLLEDPELVRESINKYIEGVQKSLAAAQTAVTVITDISNMIEERDWASKWTMKKRRSDLRKEILEKAYGMTAEEIKEFFSKAYAIKKKRDEKQTEASASPRTVKYAGHTYILQA